MEQKIKIVSLALAIIILGAGAAGLGSFSKKKTEVNQDIITPNTLKEFFTIRLPSSTSTLYVYEFAEKLGYLEEEGIKLEYTGTISGGPEAMMIVASGANDATNTGVHISATVNAVSQGLKIKAVLATSGINKNLTNAFFVLNNSGIYTAKDIRGKKIAVNTLGASSDYAIQEYLKQNNMSKDDVEIIVIGSSSAREQAFRSGQVAITSGTKKFYSFKEGGGVRPLFTQSSVYGREMSSGLILMSEKIIKEHPDIVRKFVTANVKALDWVNAHPDEAKELYRKIIIDAGGNRGKPEDADYWEGYGISNHGLIIEEDYLYWINKFVESGALKQGEIKPSDIYTNEFNPYYKK